MSKQVRIYKQVKQHKKEEEFEQDAAAVARAKESTEHSHAVSEEAEETIIDIDEPLQELGELALINSHEK